MSESGATSCCASCGVTEGDDNDVKLKKCAACHLVKYCGAKCQKVHRATHKRECKQRAAELRDEILFKQPEGCYLGDCPICFLPLSNDEKKSMLMTCCCKMICGGCWDANTEREKQEKLAHTCAFCRQPLPESDADAGKLVKDRAEMNDPVAVRTLGLLCHRDGNYRGAFEYFSKAAELGDVVSHYELALLYENGEGVEKDESKKVHHYEQAAIGGQPDARFILGIIEWNNGQREKSIKHYIIAAKLGHDESLERLKKGYKYGVVSKDDFAAALRGHQAAVDATKSPHRKRGEAFLLRWHQSRSPCPM